MGRRDGLLSDTPKKAAEKPVKQPISDIKTKSDISGRPKGLVLDAMRDLASSDIKKPK